MYQTAQPPEHLKGYIDFFWTGEVETTSGPLPAHHAIAGTKLELQFHYTGHYCTADVQGNRQQVFRAGFFGQSDRYQYYYAATKKTGIFSVRFHPHAMAMLFNAPSNLLTNESYDLASILGRQAIGLEEQIFEAKSFHQRVQIMIHFLESRLKHIRLKYQCLGAVLMKICHAKDPYTVREIAANAFLSQRQFERTFRELTGFSARYYLKILRFERAVEAITHAQSLYSPRLLDIALDFGYYDQAHFNRHFKEYTGTTPTMYFSNLAMQDQS